MRGRPLPVLAGTATLLAVHAAVNARLLRTPAATTAAATAATTDRVTTDHGVSVLLPVRDEAARVAPCVQAVLAQRGVDVELVVLDDGSADRTVQVVRRAAGNDPRVRLLTGRPLPTGWLGKPYACQQLADAAAARSDVLVFLDADVVLEPHAVAATVALLDHARLDLLCPYPRQQAPGTTRLVQPLLQWSWLTFVPLRLAERSRWAALAVANGQFLAVRRAAYDAAGGHAAVRDQVVEDVALLRAFKRTGHRGGVADGTDLASTRMYGSWSELAEGYAKSLWTVPLPALAGLGALYVVPALAALRGSPAGVLGYAAGVAGRVVAARRTGGRTADSALHPLSVAALLWLAARSRLARRRGRLTWRGRPLP